MQTLTTKDNPFTCKCGSPYFIMWANGIQCITCEREYRMQLVSMFKEKFDELLERNEVIYENKE